MAVEMPINSVITVRHEYTLGSDVQFNVLHYRFRAATVLSSGLPLATVPIAADVLPGLASQAYTEWSAVWPAPFADTVFYRSCTVQKVYTGDRSIPYTFVAEDATPGAVDSQPLPMQDAVTILKKTGYGQRWGLGRVYLSGIPELNTDSGFVNGTFTTALAPLISHIDEELSVTITGVQYFFKPVVTNVPTSGFPRVNDVTVAQLSSNVIKSQKRRRPGKGI